MKYWYSSERSRPSCLENVAVSWARSSGEKLGSGPMRASAALPGRALSSRNVSTETARSTSAQLAELAADAEGDAGQAGARGRRRRRAGVR